MNELSLYILDLVQNSISAGAKLVEIRIVVSRGEDRITVLIQDDGCGMTPEFLKRAVSPFTTTRTTRKVGLGIPMIKELCELCQGSFEIESQVGVGTALHLSFRLSNIDLPPMGNLAETMLTLVNGAPEKPEFLLEYAVDGDSFEFDTRQIRQALGGVPLDTPEVLGWMRDYLQEGIEAAGKLP